MNRSITSRTEGRVPLARALGISHGESGYTAPDMLRAPARAGALQAASCPSRMNGRLYWPDGRVTDLHGTPLN